MIKIVKKIAILVLMVFIWFGSSADNAQSQQKFCRVVQVAWSDTQVIVDQTIDLIITVNDPATCFGKNIGVNVYEDDWLKDDLIYYNFKPFPFFTSISTQFKISVKFTSSMFAAGGSEEGGQVYARAQAEAGQQTDFATSGYTYFYSKAPTTKRVAAYIDANGNYICSQSQSSTDCSDAPGYKGQACILIAPTDCGKPATVPGKPVNVNYGIPNVFESVGVTDIIGFIDLIAAWIFNFAIPVIVIIIIWTGIKFVTSRGNPGEIQKAKTLLRYALIGLAIVLIGRGFVELIVTFLQS